jgi:microcystin-dependent protein
MRRAQLVVLRSAIGAFVALASIGWRCVYADCSEYTYIGSICITAGSYCPRGYSQPEGQILKISENQALFSVLGDAFGGDGRTTFALPDLRGRTPVSIGTGMGLTPIAIGQRRGVEQHTLLLSELPSHTHDADFSPTSTGMQASTQAGAEAEPASDRYLGTITPARGAPSVSLYTSDGSQLTPIKGLNIDGDIVVEATGGGQPLFTLPPQLGLRYCIAVTGPYPPRN